MATFVLIHGVCHTGACWDEVIKHLEGQGHQVFAPTTGGNEHGADKTVSVQQVIQPIIDLFVEMDLQDVVLLGHSLGGTTVQLVAQEIPKRIKRLIFMGALLIEQEGNFFAQDFHHLDHSKTFGDIPHGQPALIQFPVWREVFMNDTDLETAQKAYKQLTPNPMNYLLKTDVTPYYSLEIPCSYLHGTEDTAIDYSFYKGNRKNLGLHRFVQYHGSHEIMYSNPEEIAQKIVIAGRD